ncbi:MAG: AmmeMemoRadiSam system radical SAM enzyme [Candidatus Shapirobacteria bacterium]
MHEAVLSKKISERDIQCLACEWKCKMKPGMVGVCGVRKNVAGKLILLVWGRVTGVAVDPMEKKPLYHFLPGSSILSMGTVGCNFSCEFCQNFLESQKSKEVGIKVGGLGDKVRSKDLVEYCVKNKIPAIAFTYNEPTIFSEWAVGVMKVAKKKGIRGVFVTNGYMSQETLDYLDNYIDAYNIDLKSFSDKFYWEVCRAKLKPVLNNIEEIYKRKKWVEVTTLIIPGKNDSQKELKQIAKFLADISKDIVWHVSAFHPDYRMLNAESTSYEKLQEAVKIGQELGLKYVYAGNIDKISNTFCPKCGVEVIVRCGYQVENKLKRGFCPKCGYKLAGVWE